MNTCDNNGPARRRLNALDYMGSRYLNTADISEPITVTVEDVFEESPAEGKPKALVVRFRELRKTLILNSARNEAMQSIFGSIYPDEWVGQVTLYIDASVKNPVGKIVGGIRIRSVAAERSVSHRTYNGPQQQYDGNEEIPFF